MKHVKLAIYAASTILGTMAIFATRTKPSFVHTYYAYYNMKMSVFSWTVSIPSGKDCFPYALIITAYCTITTNAGKPAPGKFPTLPFNHSSNQNLYQ